MSSPVLAMITTPTASTAASNGTSSMALSNQQSKASTGLFMSLLNSNASFAVSANKGAAGNGVSQYAKSGLGLDPTLLVIPQELANMSAEDLQSLLASATQDENGELNNAILVSLTPGTPGADAIADFLAKHADTTKVINLSASATTDLTANESTIPQNSSVLLVATGINPTDLEKLKESIKSLGTSSLSDAESEASSEQADTLAPDTTNALVLVMFVPTAIAQDAPTITAESGLDLLTFSTLTSAAAAEATGSHHDKSVGGKYISPFANDDLCGAAADMSDEEILAGLQQQGFQGSIASLGKETGSVSADTVSGKIDTESLLGNNSVTSTANGNTSTFAASSLLLADSQSAPHNGNASTNPLTSHGSAASSHPATQTVSLMVEKALASGKQEQTLSIQLDPPELGRVQVQLSLEKGETMKVHVLAENKDTLALLQRDSHTLRASLEQAGIQTDGSSLSFDLAGGDQSFNQMLGGSQDQSAKGNSSSFSLNAAELGLANDILELVETTLDFVPDKVTGNVHYSLLA